MAAMPAPDPERLGGRLIAAGVIGEDQLRIALSEQRRAERPLGRVLVDFGFVSEAVLRDQLGEALGQEAIDLATVVPDPAALERLPQALARRHRAVPVSWDPATPALAVALSDPADLPTLDRLRARLGANCTLRPLRAGEAEIDAALERFYGYELTLDGILHELELGPAPNPPGDADGYRHPLVRLVDAVLADAVGRGASDIHFEPAAGFVRIRYRIDGVLHTMRSLHPRHGSPITVRLKVMAGLDIAETRAPQDGRLERAVGGRAIDFRVSVVCTTHGEAVVLRVLDRHKGVLELDRLGLSRAHRDTLARMGARPEGLILITGPTGSGKTTTLYALLNEQPRDALSILTLEDPVEYPLPLVRQSAVNEAAGVDFANGVRSLMRQDPDILLIGEIRDEATATMALRAAMTGHQVYATLHTGSALGAIPRLQDIGVAASVLAGNIIGVIGQRLVRRLCPACKIPVPAGARERRLLGPEVAAEQPLYRAAGCAQCAGRGYAGRLALMEVLRIDEEFDDAITRHAPPKELRAHAAAAGFEPLVSDATRRVVEGVTSLDEVMRVIDLSDRL